MIKQTISVRKFVLNIATFVAIFFIPISVFADDDFSGVAAVEFDVNYNETTKDLDIYSTYLSGRYVTNNITIFGILEDSNSLYLDEIYIDFSLVNFDIEIGRVYLPFGIGNLCNPESSVFISSPRNDYSDMGLTLHKEYGNIILLDTTYLSSGKYVGRTTIPIWHNRNITYISVNNFDEIKDVHGKVMVSNLFRYPSTFFDVSCAMEYSPDNGNFWGRTVLSPGIFDIVGIMFGYYNVDEMGHETRNRNYTPDAFVYGCYLDLSMTTTLSIELIKGEEFSPIAAKIVGKF